jgi:hypothetical protein
VLGGLSPLITPKNLYMNVSHLCVFACAGDMFSDPIVAEMANLFEKKKQPFPIKEGGVIPSKRNRSHAIAESDQKISGDSSEFDTHTTGKRSKKMKSST